MLASKWRAHMAGGAPYTAEYRVVFPDGREVWHAAAVRILKSVKGSPARAFAVIQVITTRKQIELQGYGGRATCALVAAAAKSDFLSNMSHEIRTPLNGVLAVSEVLNRTPLDERQGEMVRLISTSGRTLLRVMDDLVEFSRLEGDDIQFDIRPFELEETYASTPAKRRGRGRRPRACSSTAFISASCRWRLSRRSGADRAGAGQPAQQRGQVHRSGPYQRLGRRRRVWPMARRRCAWSVTDTGVASRPRWRSKIFERFEQADISRPRAGMAALALACRS